MHWLPKETLNHKQEMRHVGVELEFAGVAADRICECIRQHVGGTIDFKTQFEASVAGTELGDFLVELDAQYFKDLAQSLQNDPSLQAISKDLLPNELLTKAAEQFVPWEVVSPPVAIDNLHKLKPVINSLREAGALGTRHAARYAFGVHLNPELPNLETQTILNYLRSFLCLYEWIAHAEKIDFARKITPYINHFDKKYIEIVLDEDYAPTMDDLIDDYIDLNPTRNRTLDLLPLFSFIDEERVNARLNDPRIKSRPTFHFRLPNCDIDNPNWNIDISWQHWLAVEYLAGAQEELKFLSYEYLQDLKRFSRGLDDKWLTKIRNFINENFNSSTPYVLI